MRGQAPRICACFLLLPILVGLPSAIGNGHDDGAAAPPDADHDGGSAEVLRDPLDRTDPALQAALDDVVADLGLGSAASAGRLGVALVDLSRQGEGRFAAVNGDRMIYAASLPKIAILLGAFDAVERGTLRLTAGLREQMTRMIRVSDNASATRVLERVGFRSVAATLQRPSLRLYDPATGGGLWVGKAYGRDRYWRRDPVASLSHGATARQVARFFVLLEHGELVSPAASEQMKALLAEPGIRHKFVRGLEQRPGATIYRKSGSWRDFHADAALVERGGITYVAVGLVQDRRGGEILERLIVALDDLVTGRQRTASSGAR